MREEMVAAYRRKWALIPLRENSKLPNLPKNHPYLYRHAKPDEYRDFEFGNYGIVTGPVSGICVLDIDEPEGMQTLQQLDGADLTELWTPQVKTPGGRHFYFKYDEKVKTGVNVFRNDVIEESGVDIRSKGGYVVGPGSVVDGKPYKWVPGYTPDDIGGLQDAPDWLKKERYNKIDAVPNKIVRKIDNGERNTQLSSVAGFLFTKIADYAVVEHLVQGLNKAYCVTPLPDDEVSTIVRSISRYHNVK